MNYKKETQLKKEKQIQEMLRDMPDYVSNYMNFIHLSTAASTRFEYLRDIRAFIEYLSESVGCKLSELSPDTLDKLSADDINNYLNYLTMYEKNGKNLSNENISIKRKLSSIRGLYNYLVTQEVIVHNPAFIVRVPKVSRKEPVRMDDEEAENLLNVVEYGKQTMSKKELDYHDKYGYRDFTLITLMLGTGIRVSEAVGLNISDVDLKNHCIRVIRKGGKEDTVYYSDDVTEVLKDYIDIYRPACKTDEENEDVLFLSSQKKRITPRAVQYIVKKYTLHSDVMKHITPHKLRSTFGTKLYEETSDLYLVADSLGHESVETSKIYVNQSNERKEKNRNLVQYSNGEIYEETRHTEK
ncbi:tyrosine-type recombinase/integrase [Eubacterium sp.]|uniref:tyrosine-type recombinase/integrase n=1 Tax=Eubacterium sp. TaxID=142586 RepID=UPI002589ACB9|nr:tyrosine-type recombinase/integrase [Eubacterium sp.]MCR5368763.1 tyrosine-type recombinase/integrase [Eubacterium sp.]